MIKLNNNINWNEYRTYFPSKYWNHSYFDDFINSFFKKLNRQSCFILDIGAGVLSNDIFKDFQNYYVLDPFIQNNNYAKEILNWNNINKFNYHYCLCRGALNYLTIEELRKIKELNCNFLFNTFANYPIAVDFNNAKKNQFINLNNQICFEQAIHKKIDNQIIIEHLITGENIFLKHNFYYYSLDMLKEIFNNLQIISPPNKNTTIIAIYNNK